MDLQQILAMALVAAAAAALARKYLGRKRLKRPECANCDCGEGVHTTGGGHPASTTGDTLKQ